LIPYCRLFRASGDEADVAVVGAHYIVHIADPEDRATRSVLLRVVVNAAYPIEPIAPLTDRESLPSRQAKTMPPARSRNPGLHGQPAPRRRCRQAQDLPGSGISRTYLILRMYEGSLDKTT
jgi:hypothetical protein